MVKNIDDLINGFHTPEPPMFSGDPTFADIQLTTRLLKTKAFSVNSLLGGGRYDHLGIMTVGEYTLMSNTPFNVPVDPGHLPLIAPGMDNVEENGSVQPHNDLRRMYTK
jgi:hypothetical protein